jgi:Transglycosylase-like domain
LRVLSGRLKAVLVALLATIILIGIVGPAVTLAGDPPGLARFMQAVGRVESGGNYTARNRTSGAYGRYQIIPSSWRAWADRYLGSPNARPTRANQDTVAAAKMRALYNGLRSWRRVAYSWLTGSSRSSGWSYFATRYVNRVMGYYNRSAGVALTTAAHALQHFSENSASIVYAGSWRSARHRGYAGNAVRYATAAGATASFTFTGKSVVWYGPVGRTRGQARVLIDGTLARTVNLYRSRFAARKAVFSTTWPTAGAHTLVIEVVGTARHPYVAIDELVVTK